MLCAIVALGVVAIILDVRTGKISNHIIIAFGLLFIILDLFYYTLLFQQQFTIFLLNLTVFIIIAALSYVFHLFGGGDCKLLVIIAIGYPSELYFRINDFSITLCFIVAFAFITGFGYLLIESIISALKTKKIIDKYTILKKMISAIYTYIVFLTYTSIINKVSIFASFFETFPSCLLVLYLAIAIVVSKFRYLKNKWVLSVAIFLNLILSFMLNVFPLPLDPLFFAITIFMVVFREFASLYNYRRIPIEGLQEGMILAFASSVQFQIEGCEKLPSLSTEDLKSRLTEENIIAIKKIAPKLKIYEVSIVKKIPFAIFISIGLFLYVMIGVFENAISFM